MANQLSLKPQSLGYIYVADGMNLTSVNSTQLAPNAAIFE